MIFIPIVAGALIASMAWLTVYQFKTDREKQKRDLIKPNKENGLQEAKNCPPMPSVSTPVKRSSSSGYRSNRSTSDDASWVFSDSSSYSCSSSSSSSSSCDSSSSSSCGCD